MKLLVIDGNSILNRAFYGIKLLTTKDGRFTNGIYGFLNILLKLQEQCEPNAVAVAFDVKAPTFRHNMYDGYKAGRKGMPDELKEQMPVLKEMLKALGYRTVEKEGWEADDILGTLAHQCTGDDKCFLATGDRDSLQLITDNVHVLLAATKMGKAVTTECDPEYIRFEYGVEPLQMIEIKALMGDSSDNIPGVAGIGAKTASSLIQEYGSVQHIYEMLDNGDESLNIKPGVRTKLINDRENAFLSHTLGTIRTDAPIDCDIKNYVPSECDKAKASKLFADLELFKLMERFGLNKEITANSDESKEDLIFSASVIEDGEELLKKIKEKSEAYFIASFENREIDYIAFTIDYNVLIYPNSNLSFDGTVKKLLTDSDIKKFTHDVKPIHTYAFNHGYTVSNVADDTMLAGYLLNPSSSGYDILRLAQEYFVTIPQCNELEDYPQEFLFEACVFPSLCKKLESLIEASEQTKLLHEIEIPLAEVLSNMECVGFEVDADGIHDFGEMLENRINDLTAQIYREVGYEFNLNSPKQLGKALFEDLEIPPKKKTKSGYSTNAEVLESLAEEYPVVSMVLEYRTLAKLKSTYCDGLLKVISSDGRIHSTLNQTETRTGRISSTEPNLQNIPVRSELGREMRKFFRAKDGCVLVDADYSQIELRVLADIAKDEAMINAFNNDDDIHAITASQVFNMPLEMVTPLMRNRAKAVNFGIVYGIGAFSLAKDIKVTRKEADQYIKDYLAHYSGVRNYMEHVVEKAKEDGYVSTLFGRRRYLPELSSSNGMMRSFGERVARNAPIQGTAADIIKIAMIHVFERLRNENLTSRLILQIHDELIIEAPEDEAEKALKIVQEEMENACKMSVKLRADALCGKTWYDAKG